MVVVVRPVLPTYSSAYFLLLIVFLLLLLTILLPPLPLFHKQVAGKEWAYRTVDKHIDRQTDGGATTKVM